MNTLTNLSALEMRKGLLKKDFSALELTVAHIKHIKSTNEEYNSFITITETLALEQAAEADLIIKQHGESSPALTGIPVAIKDMLVTQGIETTCASKILKGFIPPYNCTVVTKLRNAHAIVIGKTNLDEFAMGSSNENSAFGPVKNPWDSTRVPGGSSGGSAVAVALGQAPLALGTDTGGSIRQPASFCGILGLKPTYGRVSRYGAIAFASSLDQIGPFARTAGDLALFFSLIAGHDEHDSTSSKLEVPNYLTILEAGQSRGVQKLRLGVPKEYFVPGMQPNVEQSVKAGLQTLQNLGAELVEISLPHTEYAVATYYIVASAEASSNLARYDGVKFGYRAAGTKSLSEMYEQTRANGFGSEVKRRILIGTYVLSAGYYDAYYKKAQQVRTLIVNDFKAAFANKCDLIVAPTSPTTAFPLGEKSTSPLNMYLADIFTIPASLAGLPALSIPCGFDSKKLPIGLQLIAPPFSEHLLLQVAQEFSRAQPFPILQ